MRTNTTLTRGNPFVFGTVVSGNNFADREEEIKELLSDLRGGQNVLLFSPRRYGKTSLVMEVMRRLEEREFIKVYVDLFPLTSKTDFAEAYAGAIARVTSKGRKVEEVMRIIMEHIPGFKLVLKPEGAPTGLEVELTRTRKDIDKVLDSLYDLPLKVSKEQGKKTIVVFDEFQEIVNLDGEEIERRLRSKIQHHHGGVAYVFTGSRKHLLDVIFSNKNRSLYRIAKPFHLDKIASKELAPFITEKFQSAGIGVDQRVVARILEITECHPYYTQQLCHEVWNICQGSDHIGDDDIEKATKQVISNQDYAYTTLWEALRKTQRSLLVAVAKEQEGRGVGEGIYSKVFIDTYDLASPSSVQRAVASLEEKGIIDRQDEKFVIPDVFLREWLLRRSAG